jgi:hypothetical protein
MNTADTRDIYMSRQTYDYLVQNCQGWMKQHWGEYRKFWSLGGVRAYASYDKIENLRQQLPTPEGT